MLLERRIINEARHGDKVMPSMKTFFIQTPTSRDIYVIFLLNKIYIFVSEEQRLIIQFYFMCNFCTDFKMVITVSEIRQVFLFISLIK
jgi:hypothetical protein